MSEPNILTLFTINFIDRKNKTVYFNRENRSFEKIDSYGFLPLTIRIINKRFDIEEEHPLKKYEDGELAFETGVTVISIPTTIHRLNWL